MKYPGAKHRLAPWIATYLPPSRYYGEPYCGSAAMYLYLFQHVQGWPCYAVLNDVEEEIFNLFRVLRTDLATLQRLVALTPWSRAEYDALRDTPPPADPIERARRYLVLLWQGHGTNTGARGAQGWRTMGMGGMRSRASTYGVWHALPERLAVAATALKHAEIECRDARACIQDYNDPQMLLYVDPPYLGSTRNGRLYKHEMTGVLDHARLLRTLRRHRGPVVLSGYPHPLYDRLLPGWRRVETTTQAEKGQRRIECLWLNPVTQERLGYGPLFS